MMEHGTVTTVYYEEGVPVCSVQLQGRVDNQDDAVPVMRQHHGMFLVPEQGQRVQMHNIQGQRFIVGILNKGKEFDPPDLSEGDYALKLDEKTILSFTENNNGLYDVDIEASGNINVDATGDGSSISVENSGSSGTVTVSASGSSGSITVSAPQGGDIDVDGGDGTVTLSTNTPGNVVIDGIDFDQHTHDYDDSGTTETTDPPN